MNVEILNLNPKNTYFFSVRYHCRSRTDSDGDVNLDVVICSHGLNYILNHFPGYFLPSLILLASRIVYKVARE